MEQIRLSLETLKAHPGNAIASGGAVNGGVEHWMSHSFRDQRDGEVGTWDVRYYSRIVLLAYIEEI